MTTRHHRIKTHGRWQVQQPFPGIYVWRDPHGAYYLVDHTGTRRLPDGRLSPGQPRDPVRNREAPPVALPSLSIRVGTTPNQSLERNQTMPTKTAKTTKTESDGFTARSARR